VSLSRKVLLGCIAAIVVAAGAIAGDRALLFRATFIASGTNATERSGMEKMRDWVSTKDFTGTDFCTRLTRAIAVVGTGGVIHAEGDDPAGGGGWTCTTGVSISTPGITIYLPSAQINMGTNQWIVTAGTHNVTIIGASAFGAASLSLTTGTSIQYTGTGAAIAVGDSTTDTWGFLLQDVAIGINGAGTAAIGIQLNRCGRFQLYRERIELLITANTQKGIDLEGFNNYTGGMIFHPWISNGGTAIYFGKNANWNEVIAGDFPLTATGTGIALQFAGAVGGLADGNFVYGADAENCLRPLDFDYASNNQIVGLRTEACTTLVTLSANSVQNQISTNGTSSGITDNGTNNAIQTTVNPIFTQKNWKLRNQTDSTSEVSLQAGSTTGQFVLLSFLKWDGTTQWQWVKDTSELLYAQHSTTGVNRLIFFNSNTSVNGESTGSVNNNVDSGTGTGGTKFGDGAGNVKATIDSAGRVAPGAFTNATLGTPANGVVVYCSDCTIANPCAGAGNGAIAKRLNGVWVCN
jgi:hypothetical protein